MNKTWTIDPEAFEKMLRWLDEDRETAGEKYEAIRQRLIKVLGYRGCSNAEELADRVFDIITLKIDEVVRTCTTEPTRYFFGVMNNVYSEFIRRAPHFEELPETIADEKEFVDEETVRIQYDCLKKCLGKLPDTQREFILAYYRGEKAEKIRTRRQLAQSSGKSSVRVQAFRLRAALQKCVFECLKQNEE